MPRNITAADLSVELNMHERTLRNYVKNGMPCDKPTRPGQPLMFDRVEVADWMRSKLKTGLPGRPVNAGGDEKRAAEIRVLLAKAEKAEIDLARTKGELVSVADVEAGRVQRIVAVRGALLGFGAAIAPQLVGLNTPQIQDRIESEVRRILEEFSK